MKRVLDNIYDEARGLEACLEVCRARGPGLKIIRARRTVIHAIKDLRLVLFGFERD